MFALFEIEDQWKLYLTGMDLKMAFRNCFVETWCNVFVLAYKSIALLVVRSIKLGE